MSHSNVRSSSTSNGSRCGGRPNDSRTPLMASTCSSKYATYSGSLSRISDGTPTHSASPKIQGPPQAFDASDLAAAGQVFEVLDVRQLAQVLEPELEEEVFAGAVHHRAADRLLATLGDDEALVEQRLDGRGGLHAADFENLGDGHGLLVGDDGERLKGGEGELGARLRLEVGADVLVELGARGELPAARDLAQHQAAAPLVELLGEFFDRDLHPALVLLEDVGDGLDRQRVFRDEDERFAD